MAPFLMFVLEIQFEGVRARAVLNDVQVCEKASVKSGMSQTNLNPWIIEGRNKIQVYAAAEGGGTRRLVLRLLGGPHGQSPVTLAEKKVEVAGGLTLVWEHEFTPERAFGRWAWQDAAPSSLEADDRAGIVALVQEVHGALEKGNAKRLGELFAARDKEMARALGMDEAEMREGMTGMFEEFSKTRGRKVEPLDAAGLVLTPQAGGRLIQVTTAKGGAPVKGSVGEDELELAITVSRVGGRWVILR